MDSHDASTFLRLIWLVSTLSRRQAGARYRLTCREGSKTCRGSALYSRSERRLGSFVFRAELAMSASASSSVPVAEAGSAAAPSASTSTSASAAANAAQPAAYFDTEKQVYARELPNGDVEEWDGKVWQLVRLVQCSFAFRGADGRGATAQSAESMIAAQQAAYAVPGVDEHVCLSLQSNLRMADACFNRSPLRPSLSERRSANVTKSSTPPMARRRRFNRKKRPRRSRNRRRKSAIRPSM